MSTTTAMQTVVSMIHGVGASALGAVVMDSLLYWLRDGGGNSPFLGWESSEGLDTWDDAPASALVAKLLLESATKLDIPPRYARILNNLTHWGFGLATGAGYGLLVGSQKSRLWYGLPFGGAVWISGYVALPLFNLYEPIWQYDLKTLEKDLSAHGVLGTPTAAASPLLAHAQNDQEARGDTAPTTQRRST